MQILTAIRAELSVGDFATVYTGGHKRSGLCESTNFLGMKKAIPDIRDGLGVEDRVRTGGL